MSKDCLIDARGLSKKFSMSLRQSMNHGLQDSFRQLLRMGVHSDRLRADEFWAVHDASFQLQRGTSLGVMGANGSGKTTLLRILNGIYAPDVGEVTLRGRVGALIAAGAGFSPVLTGRENIFVNGALLGMSRRKLYQQMDEIIDFAEIGDFIDSPVRHYSSGMQIRLGFAIAAIAKPDVLLVDEVLAVGDMNFQKKCYEYLHQLKHDGTAIVLVSHSVSAIWALCDRGLYLEKGRVLVNGSTDDVLRAYLDFHRLEVSSELAASPVSSNAGPSGAGPENAGKELVVHSTRVLDAETNLPRNDFAFGIGFVLESEIEVFSLHPRLNFRFQIDALHYQQIAVLDSEEAGARLAPLLPGRYTIRVLVPRQNLMPGIYRINLLATASGPLVRAMDVCRLNVRQPADCLLKGIDTAVVFLDHQFAFLPEGTPQSLGA